MQPRRSYILTALSLIIALAFTTPALGKAERAKTFDASPGGTIVFDLQSGGSVTIIGWDKSEAEISYSQRGKGHTHIVDIEETRAGLSVISQTEDHNGRSKSLSIEVRLPHKFDVDFESMGGTLEIVDMEGKFSGTTMGGGLTLKDLKGKARLTTMGGPIEVSNSELDGYIKTMGGGVLLEDVVGDLEASSMGGNVRYINVRDEDGDPRAPEGISMRGLNRETVTITTMGGEITVDEAPAGAAVQTMGGDIEIHNADRFVKAKTMGGDIEIEISDGWVKATTMAGDIDVVVEQGLGDGREGVSLVSMSGDITLEIPSDLSLDLNLTISYTRNSRKDYEIVSDWDLDVEHSKDWDYDNGTPRKRIHATGVIAGGGHLIKIKTINGNIYLRTVD